MLGNLRSGDVRTWTEAAWLWGQVFSHMPDIRNSSSSLAGIRAALLFSLTSWKSRTTPKSVHKQMHSIVSQNMKLICWVTFFWRARGGEEYSRDLSSVTRGWTWALAVKAPSPDHWTAREFPWVTFKYAQLVQKTILLWGLVSLIIPFSFNLKVEYYFLLFSKCNILGV